MDFQFLDHFGSHLPRENENFVTSKFRDFTQFYSETFFFVKIVVKSGQNDFFKSLKMAKKRHFWPFFLPHYGRTSFFLTFDFNKTPL